MSSTYLINQVVAEQRHASDEQGPTRSLQQRGHRASSSPSQNVGDTERTASLLAGAVIAGLGLSRGGVGGLMLLGLGGAMAYRGYTGHCSMYQSMGISTAEN